MVDMSPDPELGGARSIGTELRAARERQGLTLPEVADLTRIPLRHLTAIENDVYEGLPATTYSAGFVKSYARILGLDGDALSRRFRSETAGRQAATQRYEPYEPLDPARTPSRLLVWGALGVALVLLLGFLYWRGTIASENPAALATQSQIQAAETPPPADQPAPQPAATVTPTPAPAAPEPGATALLTADQPVWLRVTDGTTNLFQGLMKPGDHFAVPATAADPRLRTSRVTALRVTVGNATIPPLGPPETLVKDVSLKPDALLARANGAAAAPAPVTNP